MTGLSPSGKFFYGGLILIICLRWDNYASTYLRKSLSSYPRRDNTGKIATSNSIFYLDNDALKPPIIRDPSPQGHTKYRIHINYAKDIDIL